MGVKGSFAFLRKRMGFLTCISQAYDTYHALFVVSTCTLHNYAKGGGAANLVREGNNEIPMCCNILYNTRPTVRISNHIYSGLIRDDRVL